MQQQALTVRTALAVDFGAVDALLARSYPAILKADYPPSVLVTAVPLISKAQPRLVMSGTYFVVEDGDGVIVGAGGWTRMAPPGFGEEARGVAHIRHVVCDHRRLREGIGRRLMGHIFRTSEAAGIQQYECFSTLTAVPFYAACGFSTLGPMTVALRGGIDFPAVHMRRFLKAD
ncbi:GNAT family N-acetyltransferase [Boseongicola aestuarii]|uniref:N-acetyltransferase domain-containing protein n=1 Tax=Boseongicola aestuarii TaxID=1470561 RepID=A0A238IZL8_9RHOB|nr:GNAT family N-acetyltransferase [Boseongicola aestuarii]SMX23493.1 hypothetical protein BOA8489_01602 [Boseongicola aestuarii]